jgi:hypothetical protein
MIAGMFEPDGEDVLVTSLLAGNVGLIAGAALAGAYDLSRPRVRMINLGALVGGIGGLGIDLLIQPDDAVAAIAIPLVTSLAGLGIAAHVTRDGVGERTPDDLGAALFDLSDGALTLRAPLPMPTLLPADDVNGRPVWRPGLTLEVFRATFF